MAAEIADQGKLCLCRQFFCLQRPQKRFCKTVSAQCFGKTDCPHLKALHQLTPAVPEPMGQGLFFSLEPIQAIGQEPGIMIPAPLTHKKEGVLHRLDIPKSIEGVQNILPAVYRGVIQIAQQILQQQALPVSDGRLERGCIAPITPSFSKS